MFELLLKFNIPNPLLHKVYVDSGIFGHNPLIMCWPVTAVRAFSTEDTVLMSQKSYNWSFEIWHFLVLFIEFTYISHDKMLLLLVAKFGVDS